MLTATATVGGVHLSWTVPIDNGTAITTYNISRGTSSGAEAFIVDAGNVTTFDDTPRRRRHRVLLHK